MRVTHSRSRDDRGAVVIVVAVFMIVAAVFLAFVVDIGDQRQNRRQLTTATDSPALAVAREWALAGASPSFDCDSTTVDETLAISNNPVGNPNPQYQCVFSDVDPFRSGVVTVSSRENVDYALGGVTGVDSSSTGSLTSVRVQPVVGGGLRPIAVCDSVIDRTGWTEDAPGVWRPPTSVTVPLILTNAWTGSHGVEGEICAEPGNWNQVLFAGGSGASDFRDQIANGADGPVSVNDTLDSFTGTGGLSSAQLGPLVGTSFFLPVFETTNGESGTNLEYYVSGFVEVTLESYIQAGNTTTFNLIPQRFQSSGTCCLLNEFNLEMDICDVGTIGGAANDGAAIVCEARAVPPPSGEPPPPPPPPTPDPDCDASNPVLIPSNPQIASPAAAGKLTQSLTIEAEVLDPADCGGVAIEVVKVADGDTITETAPTLSGSDLSADFPAQGPGGWKWTSGNYRVDLVQGAARMSLTTFDL